MGPGAGLHKVVGDLSLVLKQVFGFSAVCITYKGKTTLSDEEGQTADMAGLQNATFIKLVNASLDQLDAVKLLSIPT